MPKNNLKLANEWVVKSQNDLRSAEILYNENGPTDSLCFHCHQSVEKILKGFLVFQSGEFPKVHDLIHLLNLCKNTDNELGNLEDDVLFLNRFYIETRYPPDITVYSREESKKALEFSKKIVQFIINKISVLR